MNKAQTTLFGMLVGAGLAYFLDPDRGARRRAEVRDQLMQARQDLEESARTRAREMRGRAGGLLHEARTDARAADTIPRSVDAPVDNRFDSPGHAPGAETGGADAGTGDPAWS